MTSLSTFKAMTFFLLCYLWSKCLIWILVWAWDMHFASESKTVSSSMRKELRLSKSNWSFVTQSHNALETMSYSASNFVRTKAASWVLDNALSIAKRWSWISFFFINKDDCMELWAKNLSLNNCPSKVTKRIVESRSKRSANLDHTAWVVSKVWMAKVTSFVNAYIIADKALELLISHSLTDLRYSFSWIRDHCLLLIGHWVESRCRSWYPIILFKTISSSLTSNGQIFSHHVCRLCSYMLVPLWNKKVRTHRDPRTQEIHAQRDASLKPTLFKVWIWHMHIKW